MNQAIPFVQHDYPPLNTVSYNLLRSSGSALGTVRDGVVFALEIQLSPMPANSGQDRLPCSGPECWKIDADSINLSEVDSYSGHPLTIQRLCASALHTGKYQPHFPNNGIRSPVAPPMPDTIAQRLERALIRIIESPDATLDQQLTASAQLTSIKRFRPPAKQRAKRPKTSPKSSVLGTVTV